MCFEHPDAESLVDALAAHGVLAGTVSATRVRMVTHADVDDDMLAAAIGALAAI